MRNHWNDPFPDDIDVPDCIPPVVLQVEVTQNGKTCYWGRWTETPKFINGIRLVESRKWEEMPEEERDTVLLGQAFKVRVAFSEKMKEYKKPIYVNFGKASPFGANKVTGDWIADNIWEGEYHYPAVYDSNDYQGKNTISIYAQDKEGNMLDGRPGTVVAVNDTGRINYEDGDGQNGCGGYDVLHSFDIGGESGFQVSYTQPENGEQSADILEDVKARFTKPVRLGDFSQEKVQFDPSLNDSFIAAWGEGNRELSMSFASPQSDLFKNNRTTSEIREKTACVRTTG